uniref:Ribonuclease A-domain domain-containing protein n=1 Tax=Pyxicephalus adspersus TaxID=30357 RepID=A0AAV3A4S4_PYXAD|nr:TPA: hypothetical protein GDO54_017509 [Pyxicephalus adspersus]
MISKPSCLLIFGILLCVLHLSACQNWNAFRRKHVAQRVNCNSAMNRSPFRPLVSCKQLNTFIHASASTVKNICQGVIQSTNTTSRVSFRYTNCIFTSRRRRQCRYRAATGNNVICVTCERGAPVHFVRVGRC